MGKKKELPPYPALCLGVADLSIYEMVSAFNTFNNMGQYVAPTVVTRIEDKNGKVIQTFIPETNEALDEVSAYIMIQMLKGVTERGGTAHRLRFRYGLNQPMAGKTGTTQNQSDAWYMGLTPQLSCGVWVGCEDRSVHFNDMFNGQGASLALPILKLLQNGSAEAQKRNQNYVQGAEPGMLLNTVTKKVYDGSTGIEVIPCHYKLEYQEWSDFGTG
jgi:penicillin-binding protein 1A